MAVSSTFTEKLASGEEASPDPFSFIVLALPASLPEQPSNKQVEKIIDDSNLKYFMIVLINFY